jgi:tetratricopeptide (TPR) repeat protein
MALAVVSRYQDDHSPDARAARFIALARATELSRRAGKLARAVELAQGVEASYDGRSHEKAYLVGALYTSAWSLRELGRLDEALVGYDRVIELAQAGDVTGSRWYAAAALRAKAVIHASLGRDEALRGGADALRRYVRDDDVKTRELALRGLEEMSAALASDDSWEEQLAVIEIMIEELESSPDPDRSAKVALGLFSRAATLEMLDRHDEATFVRDAVIERHASDMLALLDKKIGETVDDGSPEVAGRLAATLLTKASILRQCGNEKLAVEVLDALLGRYDRSQSSLIEYVIETATDLRAELAGRDDD